MSKRKYSIYDNKINKFIKQGRGMELKHIINRG